MQRFRNWRWYTWIAVGLWATMVLALSLSLIEPLLEAFDVLLGRSRTLTERARWPLRLASGLTVLTLSWQHYVVPLLASTEITFKDRRTPRMMLRNYWLSLWMPFIVASILCVTNLIPVYAGRHTLAKWLSIQPWILIVAGALPFLALPPLLLMRAVKRRLMSNAHQQSRCFECGYDLTGVWSDNCPECGTRRPGDAIKTMSQDARATV